MVSYSPNGQRICQAFNGQQLGALGDGVDNRLVPGTSFFRVFHGWWFDLSEGTRVATSQRKVRQILGPRCFSPSTATFFSSGLKAIVVIRSSQDTGAKSTSKIKSEMACGATWQPKENHLQQDNDLRKGFLAIFMTNLSPKWCWYLYIYVCKLKYISHQSVCVGSIRWWYFSVFIPNIKKRDRTRPRAEKVVGMVHTSSDQTGAIVHSGRSGTNEARHCGNT